MNNSKLTVNINNLFERYISFIQKIEMSIIQTSFHMVK